MGGLTPNHGLIALALKHAHIPIYTMIRPRDGDFLYSSLEVEMMLHDIHHAKTQGVQGVVLGCLNKNAQVDRDILRSLMKEAKGVGVTFHRGIDCCADVHEALEIILGAGCERVLTSGLANNAVNGAETIRKMVLQCKGRLSVMAGAGVNGDNVATIINKTGVNEVHLSGKTPRQSDMETIVACATLPEFQTISVTKAENIAAIKSAIAR